MSQKLRRKISVAITNIFYRVGIGDFLWLLSKDELLFSAENLVDPLSIKYSDLGVVFLDFLHQLLCTWNTEM